MKKEKQLKVAKPVKSFYNAILNGKFCVGSKWCDREERVLSVTDTHKPYVRGKRKIRHLPDDYDTKWITIPKSWKDRFKKRYQYE